MRDKVFIDTNIFLYAFSIKDKQKQERAKNIVLNDAIISVQVINETSVNLLKKFDFNELQIKEFIESCYEHYEVVNFFKEMLFTASGIREKYRYSYYDSLIIAAALLNKCNVLFSEDMQHKQVIEKQLTIINPFFKS